MLKPPIPHDETLRLQVLHSLKILDTPAEERFERITRMAVRMFQVPTALFSLVDSNRQWFKSRQGLDACETSRAISFCGHAIAVGGTFVVEDTRADERFSDNPLVTGEPHIRFYAGQPVSAPNGSRIGTLCLIDSKPREFTAEDCDLLAELGQLVEMELTSMTLATTDDLTRLANRRGFRQVAENVLALCKRFDRPLQLVLFDLDDFKPINDTHGHAAGDQILVDFARTLLKSFRDSDVIARVGGDEFCALLTGTDSNGLALCLDRLRAVINAENKSRVAPLSFTAGAVAYDPKRHDSLDALLGDADERMYAAKAQKKSVRRASAG